MKNLNFNKIFIKQASLPPKGKVGYWPGNIERDWRILVYFFAVGLLLISFFALKIYLSDQIAGGYLNSETTSSGVSTKVLNQKKLQADLLIMQTKKEAFVKLKTYPPKIVDPAL